MSWKRAALNSAALAALACGGSGGGGLDDLTPPNQGHVAIVPGGLTLKIGAQGTLTATYIDASGVPVSGVKPTWISRGSGVAAVDANGTVTGISPGLTTVVATANGKSDSVGVVVFDDLLLEVQPGSGSIKPGGSMQFTVVARNGSGQVIATPSGIVWSSSAPGVASVSQTGLAVGIAKGVTAVTASARGVTSAPAFLTVDNSATQCDGIASVTSWNANVSFNYTARGTTEGGFVIDGTYTGAVKATLTLSGVVTPVSVAWTGTATGTAALHETKTDPTKPNSTEKHDAEGQVLTVGSGSGSSPPTIQLIVDLTTCTYRVTEIAGLNVQTTQPDGKTSRADALVEAIYAGTQSLGAWKSLNISDVSGISYEGHSAAWAGQNLTKNAFVPLGFAAQLLTGAANEAPAGGASVTYTITRNP